MRVRFDARGDANEHTRRDAVFRVQHIEPVELVEGVDDDRRFGLPGRAQFVDALVVAVHDELVAART